ncbi:MAG: M1 family metallopeptidase [Armatimonadetes bacterium]|nr:M1 family metallopeptidase [Armatimonadota bacterium]
MARLDPHSYNDSSQPDVVALHWSARVDFERRVIDAAATLTLEAPGLTLDLDTRDLDIHAVEDEAGHALEFTLHPPEPILGARLEVKIRPATRAVRVRYSTSPTASALQWLTPAQTFGGRHPFLFSQCQAIHARSVVPLQDTPRVRIRYKAAMEVPTELRALMAAAFVQRDERGEVAVERWEMPQPIPPYLFAFAVGDLQGQDVGPRTRVWAEPAILERAAAEFGGADDMLAAAESMFGDYDWDRFDILTMPQSFPYGGMENPRLTFLTPTLLAGDRSLVNVVAHELAHSWTGNLVSNASANDFWLNEGFTVFAERRIAERLEGPDVMALQEAIGRKALEDAVADFSDRPQLTRLRCDLAGHDPDEVYSSVPYEKGYLFLRTLETHVGRAEFDRFLRAYIDRFRFQAITTADFEAFCEEILPGALRGVRASEWIDGPGIPDNAPPAKSQRLEAVKALGDRLPDECTTATWTPAEWVIYLEGLPRPLPLEKCAALEEKFALNTRTNYEVLVTWLDVAAAAGYLPAVPYVEKVLADVGRMKYLKPLYKTLARNDATREVAIRCFERNAESYHPIARQVLGEVLETAPV